MLAALQGKPWPALPALPGRRHACTDRPISEDELQGVTSPTELALLLGITRQAAVQRLRRQAELHSATVARGTVARPPTPLLPTIVSSTTKDRDHD